MATGPTATNCIEFLKQIGKLKHIKRTGWVLRNVNNPETIGGHMYRMGVMSFIIDDSYNVDKDRVMKMALVHDMAECTVGDLTPHCGVSVEDKHQKEEAAMKNLAELLGPSIGGEMYQLFMEYEKQETSEAKLVKDFDKFDMILQAFEYECDQDRTGSLEEFFSSTKGAFKHPKIQEWVDELYNQRASKRTTES